MRILLITLTFLIFSNNGYADAIDEKLYFYANGNATSPYEEHYNYLFRAEKKELAILRNSPKSLLGWASLYLVYMGLMYTKAIDIGSSAPLVTVYENKMINARDYLFRHTSSDESVNADFYHFIVGGLSDELKVVAYGRMLKTPSYGETDDIRTGDYFQYSNAYFRMGEYDKAIDVLNQMMGEKEAGNSRLNVTREYIQSRIQEAESKKLEVVQVSQQDQYSQAVEAVAEPKAAAEKASKGVEPKKTEKPKDSNQRYESDNNTILWWLLGGGTVLLTLLGWFLRRRRE